MFTVINCVNFPQHSFFICQSWYWKNSYCMCFCWISLRFEIDSYYYWKKCWKNSLDFDDWSDFCLFIIALCLSWKNYLFLKKHFSYCLVKQCNLYLASHIFLECSHGMNRQKCLWNFIFFLQSPVFPFDQTLWQKFYPECDEIFVFIPQQSHISPKVLQLSFKLFFLHLLFTFSRKFAKFLVRYLCVYFL